MNPAVLQNIHLVAKWLGTLEKLLEKFSQGSHRDYRVFMSAEAAPSPQEHIVPQGLLENSIKITNEPPTGMLAGLHAALCNFDQVRKQMLLLLQQVGVFSGQCRVFINPCISFRREK